MATISQFVAIFNLFTSLLHLLGVGSDEQPETGHAAAHPRSSGVASIASVTSATPLASRRRCRLL